MSWSNSGRVILAGLGNPGSKYEMTRHNWGFLLIDVLARRGMLSLSKDKFHAKFGSGFLFNRQCTLLKPQTFMNRSGLSVARALTFHDLETSQCVVIHDDLDLPFGIVRVKTGGGHGGHNGLRSIMADTGQRNFVRVRMGIGRPKHGSAADWVLKRFSEGEQAVLSEILDVGARAVEEILTKGPKSAQNLINGMTPSWLEAKL